MYTAPKQSSSLVALCGLQDGQHDLWGPVLAENGELPGQEHEGFQDSGAEHSVKHRTLLSTGPCKTALGPGARSGPLQGTESPSAHRAAWQPRLTRSLPPE